MVVLLIGRFGNFENLESHIKDSFEELGNQVIPFDIWGGELRSKNKILVYIN